MVKRRNSKTIAMCWRRHFPEVVQTQQPDHKKFPSKTQKQNDDTANVDLSHHFGRYYRLNPAFDEVFITNSRQGVENELNVKSMWSTRQKEEKRFFSQKPQINEMPRIMHTVNGFRAL